MKTLTNINVIFFIVYIYIITDKTHSASINDRDSNELVGTESEMNAENHSTENIVPHQGHPWFGKRRLDSAEKYFDWAGKTNRPMEYLRGKRFWIFTKKVENNFNHEAMRDANSSPNKGIWRSGIVGRRRR
ncbi:unnamed protein product [Adineta steineri]|uniref:Uncharacterized protein n=1 Tax=Adineta steineri TaxID=433720 RepID=A0A815ITP6_9BILA|nr:unnamed protein product [Adineta steineri]CAF3699094.1 unnamed protein product [Adineta steineri]